MNIIKKCLHALEKKLGLRVDPINVKTKKIRGQDRILVITTNERTGDTKKTTVTFFTKEEIEKIHEAQRNLDLRICPRCRQKI